jgi:hypothetical protein
LNTFGLDLYAVRARVLLDPWVADARVRRILPHDLAVTVTERAPVAVAIDGAMRSLLDADGRVLASDAGPPSEDDARLPQVTGLDHVAADQKDARRTRGAASLEAIRRVSPAFYARLASIDVSADDRLVLASDGMPPVWIDGPESADEVAGYACRMETVRRTFGPVAHVDARWQGRLFVLPVSRQSG